MSITKEENSAFVVNQQHSNNNVSSEPVIVTGQTQTEEKQTQEKPAEKKMEKSDGTSPPQIILQVPTCVSECCLAWFLFLQEFFLF